MQVATSFGTYDFVTANISVPWNPIGGVYMFADTRSVTPRIFYVGICENFKIRLAAHERWLEAKRLEANKVLACRVDNPQTRNALEKYLLMLYRPTLNTSHREDKVGELLRA